MKTLEKKIGKSRMVSEPIDDDSSFIYVPAEDFFRLSMHIYEEAKFSNDDQLFLFSRYLSDVERFFWQLSVNCVSGETLFEDFIVNETCVKHFRIYNTVKHHRMFAELKTARNVMLAEIDDFHLPFIMKPDET